MIPSIIKRPTLVRIAKRRGGICSIIICELDSLVNAEIYQCPALWIWYLMAKTIANKSPVNEATLEFSMRLKILTSKGFLG